MTKTATAPKEVKRMSEQERAEYIHVDYRVQKGLIADIGEMAKEDMRNRTSMMTVILQRAVDTWKQETGRK